MRHPLSCTDTNENNSKIIQIIVAETVQMVPFVGYQRFPVDPGPHLDLLEDRQLNLRYVSQGIVDEIFCPLSVDPLEKIEKN